MSKKSDKGSTKKSLSSASPETAVPKEPSQKGAEFAREPMKGKHVTALPGIGSSHGRDLEKAGYESAEKVFGMYLASGRDTEKTQDFLKQTGRANDRQASECVAGMKDWHNQNM